jgi:hypothetical protein
VTGNGTRFASLIYWERDRARIGGEHGPARGSGPATERRGAMRKLLLTLVLAAASVGLVGLTPSTAKAQWWRRGYYSTYYYPEYTYGYYPGYSTYYYSAPSYYSYNYAVPGYSYGYSYAMPGYSYGTYYAPVYRYGYYAPSVSYYAWP